VVSEEETQKKEKKSQGPRRPREGGRTGHLGLDSIAGGEKRRDGQKVNLEIITLSEG